MRQPIALILALFTASACFAVEPISFVGTVTNTTNPKLPTSAEAAINLDKDGHCILRVSPPLFGSGVCTIKNYDEKTGHLEIVSEGVLLNIAATGTVNGSTFTGAYSVVSTATPDLPQSGTFQFTVGPGSDKTAQLSDVLSWQTVKSGDQDFLLIRDGNTVSVHLKDGKYAGRRVILGKDDAPTILIEDSDYISTYRDFKTNTVLVTWVKDGESGYFVQPVAGGLSYLDRFFQPTGWSSIQVDQKKIFVHELNGDLELFDDAIKPLGIRSGKTTTGQVFWSKSTGEITEFFDQSFKPLGWYSIQRDGNTYYARAKGKNKFVFFDATLHELKRPRESGFWANFARGMAAGLAASGNAMQQAQAYQARQAQVYAPGPVYPYTSISSTIGSPSFTTTTTTDSFGNSYRTNSQQLGNFTFSNTTGSNGYTANSTTQQLGPFEFMHGNSNYGAFSGTGQRIGNFDFTHLTTPAGTWNGTSNQIGNITFHNFTGPNGQSVNGTSTQIGNFIFTNLH